MKKCVSKLKIFCSKNEDSAPAIDPVLLSVRQKPIEEFLGLPPVSNFEKIRSSRETRDTIHSSLRRVHSRGVRTGSYSFRVSSDPPGWERGCPAVTVSRSRSLNVGQLSPLYQARLATRRETSDSEPRATRRPLMGTLSLSLMAGSPNSSITSTSTPPTLKRSRISTVALSPCLSPSPLKTCRLEPPSGLSGQEEKTSDWSSYAARAGE